MEGVDEILGRRGGSEDVLQGKKRVEGGGVVNILDSQSVIFIPVIDQQKRLVGLVLPLSYLKALISLL